MGWKSKPRNDWSHVNQLIQHFNDYANRHKFKLLKQKPLTWGKVSNRAIVDINKVSAKLLAILD